MHVITSETLRAGLIAAKAHKAVQLDGRFSTLKPIPFHWKQRATQRQASYRYTAAFGSPRESK